MAASQVHEVIQQLRRSVLLREGAAASDGQLLGCFVEHRDDAAFAALLGRHGPMVWGVCRRLLGPHDAEDAFQATFLVLVRKAASVVPRERVANWLYGVAHQTALHARRTTARRRAREKQVARIPEPGVMEQDLWQDLQPLLDQELSRLPDAYREVIVLSDLEGRTRREVARQLGVPEGTVGSRLARARTMLAKRLTQRGVALSGGALVAVLSQNVASAGVPSSVMSSAIQAATVFGAGGVISAQVAALTQGVLKTMLLEKLKSVLAILLAVAIAGVSAVGAAGFLRQTLASEPSSARARSNKGVKPAAPAPKTDKDRLQGTWRLVSTESDGLRIGEGRPELKGYRLVIEKSSLTLSCAPPPPLTKPEPITAVAEFSLDTRRTPKVIVLRWKKSLTGKKNVTQRAIYAVKGDTLELCSYLYDENKKDPPTDFSANVGSKRALWTLKREPASGKKDEKPMQREEKKGFTAWGEPVGGLQAGLGLRPGERRAYHHGETVTLVVRVRNIGKETVKFQYVRQFLDENPPTVTDAAGKTVPQPGIDVLGFHPPVEVTLEPGKETELESRLAGGARRAGASGLRYFLRPARGGGKPTTEQEPLFVGTGKISLQYERVLGSSSAGGIKLDPALSKLATGKLELEIKPAVPAVPEKK